MPSTQFPRQTPLIDYQHQAHRAKEAFDEAFADAAVAQWWRLARETLAYGTQVADAFGTTFARIVGGTLRGLVVEMRRASPTLDRHFGPFLGGYVLARLAHAIGREDLEGICPPRFARLFLPDGTLNVIEIAPGGDLTHYGEASPLMRRQVAEYYERAIAPQVPKGRPPGSHGHPTLEEMTQAMRRLKRKCPMPSKRAFLQQLGRTRDDERRVNDWLKPYGMTYTNLQEIDLTS